MNFTLKNIIFYHSHMQSKTVHVARTFRYKSVKTSQTDYVKVDFSTYRGGDKENIVFKDRYGIKLKLIDDNTLAFTASNKPDTNYIYAYDKDGVRIGKLMVKTYEQKTYNLVLVSVNGEKLPNTNKLKEYLNKIYKQSVTTFEISTTTLEINDLFPFKHGDKKRLSGYNEDQKRVLQAFDSQIKPDINYLFFMPDGVETDGVAGYNPFGYNFGFIYHGAGERTIAHELGHGIASLHHPFNEQSFEKGNTANLMDYNFAEELYHFQWDNIQNPPSRIFKWNFEEEGAEDLEDTRIQCISDASALDKINKYRIFYLPDGRVVDLSNSGIIVSGFVAKDLSGEETTLGGLASTKENGYDSRGKFNRTDQIVTKFSQSTSVETFLVEGKESNAVRIFINKEKGVLSVMQNEVLIEEVIFDGQVGCKDKPIMETDIYKTFVLEMTDDDYKKAVETLVQRLNRQVDKKEYFLADIENQDDNSIKDYNDRFKVFNSETQNSIYVDFCMFDKKPTSEQAEKMAKEVYEKSNLANDDKSIYLLLPHWNEHHIKNNLRQFDDYKFTKSFYSKNQKYSNISYKNINGNLIEVIDGIYRLVPKPYVQFAYTITVDGTIILARNQSHNLGDIVGYNHIYELAISCDKNFAKFASLSKSINDFNSHIEGYTTAQNKNNYYTIQAHARNIEQRENLLQQIDPEYIDVNHGLLESALCPINGRYEIPQQFLNWYVQHKIADFSKSPDDKYFILGRNQVVYEENLEAIDVLGFALGVAGLDFISDGIGLFYTAYYHDYELSALYSIGMVTEGVSAGILKQAIQRTKRIDVNVNTKTLKPVDIKRNTTTISKNSNLDIFLDKIEKLDEESKNIIDKYLSELKLSEQKNFFDNVNFAEISDKNIPEFMKWYCKSDVINRSSFDKIVSKDNFCSTWEILVNNKDIASYYKIASGVEIFMNNPNLLKLVDLKFDFNLESLIELKKIATDDFVSAYKKIKESGLPNEWYATMDDLNKLVGKAEIMSKNWKILKTKNIKISDLEVFDKICDSKISLQNIDRTFNSNTINDICKIIKDNNLTQQEWNVLLGNFDDVLDFSKEEKFSRYIDNSEDCLKEIVDFAGKDDLKDFFIAELKKTIKYQALEYGKSYVQELIYQLVSNSLRYILFDETPKFDFKACSKNAHGSRANLFKSKKNGKIYLCILGTDYSKWIALFEGKEVSNNIKDLLVGCFLNKIDNGNIFWKGILVQVIKDALNYYSTKYVNVLSNDDCIKISLHDKYGLFFNISNFEIKYKPSEENIENYNDLIKILDFNNLITSILNNNN